MLLAEAMLEKEYIEESIEKINSYIHNLLVVIDNLDAKPNKSLIEKRLEELDGLYKKHQQFNIMLNRAKSQAKLKIKNMERTLRDAETIKESMERKLSDFEDLLHRASKAMSDNKVVCIETESVIKEMRLDIKTIDIKIQYVMWNTEIS